MGRYKWSQQELVLLGLLREVRMNKGLSGPAVQKKLQRPNSYIAKVEMGEKRLDILELYELCQVYEMSLTTFSQMLEQRLNQMEMRTGLDRHH
ncbi:MAG: helix-turn-helix transcriptional regulator [Zetaproteobacteria bacterium]|nr:helix-turn-helix transcriptional regulator [Zetaproteobacteria bacterium]